MKIKDIERAMDEAAGRAVTMHPDGSVTVETCPQCDALRERLVRVEMLHSRTCQEEGRCWHCEEPAPCPTLRAARGEEETK